MTGCMHYISIQSINVDLIESIIIIFKIFCMIILLALININQHANIYSNCTLLSDSFIIYYVEK